MDKLLSIVEDEWKNLCEGNTSTETSASPELVDDKYKAEIELRKRREKLTEEIRNLDNAAASQGRSDLSLEGIFSASSQKTSDIKRKTPVSARYKDVAELRKRQAELVEEMKVLDNAEAGRPVKQHLSSQIEGNTRADIKTPSGDTQGPKQPCSRTIACATADIPAHRPAKKRILSEDLVEGEDTVHLLHHYRAILNRINEETITLSELNNLKLNLETLISKAVIRKIIMQQKTKK